MSTSEPPADTTPLNASLSSDEEYEAILRTVRAWPLNWRVSLMQDILSTIQAREEQPRPRKHTLEHALGLLAGDWPTPTDEEVERMLDEARWEKYGR